MPNRKMDVSAVELLIAGFCCLLFGFFVGLSLAGARPLIDAASSPDASSDLSLDKQFSRLSPEEKQIALVFVQLVRSQFLKKQPEENDSSIDNLSNDPPFFTACHAAI